MVLELGPPQSSRTLGGKTLGGWVMADMARTARCRALTALFIGLILGTGGIGGGGQAIAAKARGGDDLAQECKAGLEAEDAAKALAFCELDAQRRGAGPDAFEALGDAYALNAKWAESKDAYRRALHLGGPANRLRHKIATGGPLPEPAPLGEGDKVVISSDGVRVISRNAQTGPIEGDRIDVETLPEPEPRYLPATAAPASSPDPSPDTSPDPNPDPNRNPAAARKVLSNPPPAETAPAQVAEEPVPAAPVSQSAASYRVQLASMSSPERADDHGALLQKRFSDLLNLLHYRRESIVLEGRGRFHRVQFDGLPTRDAANALCQRLKTLGQDCLVPAS